MLKSYINIINNINIKYNINNILNNNLKILNVSK